MLTKTPGWRILARELITNGANIHAVSRAPYWPDFGGLQTPFVRLFGGRWWLRRRDSVPRLFQRIATMWLEDLVASGVDLVEYGRKEKEIWDLSSTSTDVPFLLGPSSASDCGERHIHVIIFDFGAAPGDWHIWWSEPTDFLAGEFWAMIENSGL